MELEMYAYRRYASVAKYCGNDRFVVIPQTYKGVPVTEIKEGVFADSAVEAVIIPPTLQTISANAFANCRKLRYVGFELDVDVLMDLPVLEDDTQYDFNEIFPSLSIFPPRLQTIESGAFKNTALQRVEFKATSIELGDSVFEGCRNLEMAVFFECDSISLGKRVFMDSAIARFYAPKVRFDTIPEYSFANCTNLISVMARINAVGNRSFYHCRQLKTLNTPKKLRSIGNEAFTGCDMLEGLGKPAKKAPVKIPFSELGSNLDLLDQKLQEQDVKQIDPELQRKRLSLLWTLYKIEDKAKEVDEMDQYIWETEDTSSTLGDPLFRMSIDYRGNPAKTIPSRIKGIWGKDASAYYFSIQTPSSLSSVGMKTLLGQNLINIMPILNYVVKNSMTIILLGKQDRNIYSVYEILPVQTNNPAKDISLEFFHEMIERIKRPVPKGVELGTMMPPFTMRSEDEFDTFINICGPRLPAWVVNAYHKNKNTLKRAGNWSSSDERKHAHRAQEILMNIDWLPHVVDVPPVDVVRKLLDEAFFGLEEVKTRIEEVVAQIRRTGALPKWGILLNGPAGTGKTSIAKVIARIFCMAIIQMDMSSLGEDPDEISGSSRIYSNARPGMLLESMYRIRSSTAVLLANEVDKAGEGKGGRSAADILLTILDKTGFYENFLEEVVPTDNLFCIGTCNDLSKISKPLRDRFLIINIPGYTPAEKKVIFNDYVFPIAMEKSNITDAQMDVDEDAVDLLVSEYAVEPGARDLEQYAERFVGDFCRHVDDEVVHSKRTYTVEDVKEMFGPGRAVVRNFAINPGEVNAAFYHNGKAHFFLMEASVTPGSGKFEVLGPIGKLQEEYCKVAYWCVRNTTNSSACDLSKCDVTVFVPQAIPEGTDNHVGLACYAAICSKILNRNLAIKDICFVGGCDLNGSLYFDENDLTPLLRSMKARGVSTLYAPMGTNRLVDAKVNCECNVTIIEGPDATTLFSLAVTRSNRRC